MKRKKYNQSILDFSALFQDRISALKKDIKEGEKFLSKSILLKTVSDISGCEGDFEETLSKPMLESVKVRKLSSLCSRIGAHHDTIQNSKSMYKRLSGVFSSAENILNISQKYSLQWSLIESEYRIGCEAVKFGNIDLYEIIYTNIKGHINQLQNQIIEDKKKADEVANKVINELESVVNDDLSTFVLDDATMDFLLTTYDDISSNEGGEISGIGNIDYTREQVQEATRLVTIRKNQIKILSAVDKIIKDRLSISENPFYTVVSGEDIKEIDDYDEYFERSIRAINR